MIALIVALVQWCEKSKLSENETLRITKYFDAMDASLQLRLLNSDRILF